jgi:hypothetical protein
MNIRKGIDEKKRGKEEKRRKDAKEAGVVLEREVRGKRKEGRRERGVGGPGVGRMRGGMLVLSKRDIVEVQGRKGGRGRGGKRR